MGISLAGGISLGGGAAGYWDLEVSKAGDTPRVTNIRTADPDLVIPLSLGRQVVELDFLCSCADAAPDIRWAFAEADGLIMTAASFIYRMDSQGTLPSTETTAIVGDVTADVILQIGAGLVNFVNVQLRCIVTTAGTLEWRWAQSNINAIPTIVLANSNLKVHRLGA